MRALAVVLLLPLSVSTRTPAQTPDLLTIAQRSDVVVLARCTQTDSHWDDDAGVIVTDVTLAVERSFQGAAPEAITVRTLGGRVGSISMGASHATRFAPDARVVALLRQSRFGPYFVTTSSTVGPLVVTDSPAGPRVAVGDRMMDLDRLHEWLGAAGR